MEKSLAELHAAWASKKERYEHLLHEWLPAAGPDAVPLRPLPDEVRAELERLEQEVEQARLAYVDALLYRPRE